MRQPNRRHLPECPSLLTDKSTHKYTSIHTNSSLILLNHFFFHLLLIPLAPLISIHHLLFQFILTVLLLLGSQAHPCLIPTCPHYPHLQCMFLWISVINWSSALSAPSWLPKSAHMAQVKVIFLTTFLYKYGCQNTNGSQALEKLLLLMMVITGISNGDDADLSTRHSYCICAQQSFISSAANAMSLIFMSFLLSYGSTAQL